MLKIILILILLGIIGSIIEFIQDNLLVTITLVTIVVSIILCFTVSVGFIVVPVLILFAKFVMEILDKNERIKREAERKGARNQRIQSNKKWLEENSTIFTQEEIKELLYPPINEVIKRHGIIDDYVFIPSNMPYGRANVFLNHFNKSIYSEEPLFYSCEPSKIDTEFREYGLLITTKGIYSMLQQGKKKDKTYEIVKGYIPFAGLKNVKKIDINDDELLRIRWEGIDKYGDDIQRDIDVRYRVRDSIVELCNVVIQEKLNIAYYNDTVYESKQDIELHTKKSQKWNREENVDRTIDISALGTASHIFEKSFAETKNYMNASGGGGYAAEYGNNTADRLKGSSVESTAQVLDEHGHQIKAGADRTVNGVEIQTKYYKTASESIGAAFKNGHAIYIKSDGTGKMMEIEVPRDQYEDAITIMQKKIDSGQVPGIEPGEEAATYVRKGTFTYAQAWNIAKAGTIESLTVDVASGAICSSGVASISALIVFSQMVWEGKSFEDAAACSIATGIKILGKSTMIYTVSMQLSRAEFANPFVKEFLKGGESKGQAGIKNPVYNYSEEIARRINGSEIAKSKIGQKLGIVDLTGRQLISNVLVGIITYGPDIYKLMKGKISSDQFIKNSVISSASLAAASIGNGFVPIAGGILGGAIGGFVAKKIVDEFLVDDRIRMFAILKEEFIDVVGISNLSGYELEEMTNLTVGSKELSSILQNMYASCEYRSYAKLAIIQPALISIISKRKKISALDYEESINKAILVAN